MDRWANIRSSDQPSFFDRSRPLRCKSRPAKVARVLVGGLEDAVSPVMVLMPPCPEPVTAMTFPPLWPASLFSSHASMWRAPDAVLLGSSCGGNLSSLACVIVLRAQKPTNRDVGKGISRACEPGSSWPMGSDWVQIGADERSSLSEDTRWPKLVFPATPAERSVRVWREAR